VPFAGYLQSESAAPAGGEETYVSITVPTLRLLMVAAWIHVETTQLLHFLRYWTEIYLGSFCQWHCLWPPSLESLQDVHDYTCGRSSSCYLLHHTNAFISTSGAPYQSDGFLWHYWRRNFRSQTLVPLQILSPFFSLVQSISQLYLV
jgi:hypothetical protein